MPTVYSRCVAFTQKTRFKFNQKKRLNIGSMVAAELKGIPFILVENEEPEGVFKVRDYSSESIPFIDAIIEKYYQKLIAKKPQKQAEKPKRKRIPKPAFTGRKLS